MASITTKSTTIIAVCLISTMLYETVTAQPGCTTALMGLAPCLSYISGTTSTPGTICCTQLQNVVKTQANCLCQVLNSTATTSFGVAINQTQALQLPSACKVVTPPVSQCNGNLEATSPASSPTRSPVDASTPEASTIPKVSNIPTTGLGSASKSTNKSESAGNMNKYPLHLSLLFLILSSSVFSNIIT